VTRDFRQKQLAGAAGALAAAAVVGLTLVFGQTLARGFPLPADDAASRLAFVAQWLVWPGLALLIGVQAAARRGFYPEAIDGTRAPANHALEINLRYNTNTVEQILLATIAWTALAVTLPVRDLVAIPLLAILFVAGRATFWIGYLIHPMGRAFGMTLTAVPTLLAYAWLVFQWVAKA
jgi:hypothetical protein